MTKYWQQAVQNLWGIKGRFRQLDGEYDLNFRIDSTHILKVMRDGCQTDFVDLQCCALNHLRTFSLPLVVPSQKGRPFEICKNEKGCDRILWVLENLDGKTWAEFKPKTRHLILKLGETIGAMDNALTGFDHSGLYREFKWHLPSGDWIADNLGMIADATRQKIIRQILDDFAGIKAGLDALPSQAIHNDINDYNILVTGSLHDSPAISGIIDLGDMCAAPVVCDLAIAAAYVVLDHPNPESALEDLVKGFHSAYPLSLKEIDMIWPLLRLRLAVSVVNSTMMAQEKPDDPYVLISQGPAWAFLESRKVNPDLIAARLRVACGLGVNDSAKSIMEWLDENRGCFAQVLGQPLDTLPRVSLSVAESTLPQNPFDLTPEEATTLDVETQGFHLGYYAEPRLIYTDKAFYKGPFKASNRRTVHIGVDIFAPAGTRVHAPLNATVEAVENRKDNLDYGGLVILRHETEKGAPFFTLYGHLNPESIGALTAGQLIGKGQVIAALGEQQHNGGWAPHLHFQTGLINTNPNWPGAVDPDELNFWSMLYPNPAAILNLDDERLAYRPPSKVGVLAERKARFGQNLKLTYTDPVMFLRGWKTHLFDEWGRPFLDSYNNVPHVGHAHPRIQAVAADQLQRMNSNTRYLHPAQIAFAEKIASYMPEALSVCFFVNSGSEANELSLRLARAHSGGKDMITPDHGYHGNTTGCIDISAYKFNAKGGVGPSEWVHLIEVPDDFRGRFRRGEADIAQKYADLVDEALANISACDGKLAGFIAETFPSVGGQIIPPKGYLPAVYEKIRKAGGVCIADEVQTGLGRLGDYYFGFEQQGVVPDIVVLGKPIGNGHPLGVVVTTKQIADSFAKGPEFFSTFGGSTLSCRTGLEVLNIVEDEHLQKNAKQMGDKLLAGLHGLQKKYEIVGDVRGYGLFIGLDLVKNLQTREPGTVLADYVKNRMREHRILMGSEGPYDNILKIRPPMTVENEDIDYILEVMDKVLDEAQSLMGL
ncbi:aminotransferase class III-fold pyridoxal phosphate-dependent enzyme [Desulfobacula sp.]|uniref:aminotransferase class III-fold pyridoxal phosphate-dependent enzyme n=1 Tax=Desulfobacula sp. TaxID=2593537 RepID=UPI0025C545CF|nr:aminotransferase class III-fold pyridoxal phosphate-dependent enzyme [Desulfobacula sp.]MBC2704209.1 aminotransferase class III-fold pyridoxal phosphate-dependent enzyme [Desulfobacula sp.]